MARDFVLPISWHIFLLDVAGGPRYMAIDNSMRCAPRLSTNIAIVRRREVIPPETKDPDSFYETPSPFLYSRPRSPGRRRRKEVVVIL